MVRLAGAATQVDIDSLKDDMRSDNAILSPSRLNRDIWFKVQYWTSFQICHGFL